MSDGPTMEMPRYVSHKKVWALEIKDVGPLSNGEEIGERHHVVTFAESGFAPLECPLAMFARYRPVSGDFLVEYGDGYRSFSPRKAFLEGYTRDEPNALELGAAARKADLA